MGMKCFKNKLSTRARITKGLSQGLGLKLRLLSQVSAQKLLNFCFRLSGIHKEFKTGLRLREGLNSKTDW